MIQGCAFLDNLSGANVVLGIKCGGINVRNRKIQRALKKHDYLITENQKTNIKQIYGSPGGCKYLTTEAAALQNLLNEKGVNKYANQIQRATL